MIVNLHAVHTISHKKLVNLDSLQGLVLTILLCMFCILPKTDGLQTADLFLLVSDPAFVT